MIQIVPAIDLIGGRCVRLTKGDYASVKVYDASPVDTARSYADCGVRRIHLVDLDGAKASRPCNLAVLEQIAATVPCELEWGGGIASSDDLARVFDAGASHAIIGSVAALQPERFEEWLTRYGSRMVLGADVRRTEGLPVLPKEPFPKCPATTEGLPVPPVKEKSALAEWRVAVKGWQEEAPLSLDAILTRFAGTAANGSLRGAFSHAPCDEKEAVATGALREAIVTDIGRDGMLQGPTTELYVQLRKAFPEVVFTVSGGVSSLDDIRALDAAGLQRAIVGKALYENRITLKDIALWSQKG